MFYVMYPYYALQTGWYRYRYICNILYNTKSKYTYIHDMHTLHKYLGLLYVHTYITYIVHRHTVLAFNFLSKNLCKIKTMLFLWNLCITICITGKVKRCASRTQGVVRGTLFLIGKLFIFVIPACMVKQWQFFWCKAKGVSIFPALISFLNWYMLYKYTNSCNVKISPVFNSSTKVRWDKNSCSHPYGLR
jgi:hypothetical protein